jgi:hypothetical protein
MEISIRLWCKFSAWGKLLFSEKDTAALAGAGVDRFFRALFPIAGGVR